MSKSLTAPASWPNSARHTPRLQWAASSPGRQPDGGGVIPDGSGEFLAQGTVVFPNQVILNRPGSR